jgi:hypothetical protein
MAIHLALKTIAAIDENITRDQGASYRIALGKIMPHMGDAYRGADEGFRSHLGASVLGGECAREIWYGFRWFKKAHFPSRIIRLFNRGHLEEARFLAMLLAIGCQVFQQDEHGNQFRISELGGHLGGAGDGVAIGIPDLAAGQPCLLEFKTHGEKSYIKLVKEGVRVAKFEHFVQMQTYMRKMGIPVCLYGAVNKNTDDIHWELVYLEIDFADQFIERGKTIIMLNRAPDRMQNASPGLYKCRYCDKKEICFDNVTPEHNCRTCMYAVPREDGTWWCESKTRQMNMLFGNESEYAKIGEGFQLTKERQLLGCEQFYTPV